MDEDAEFRDIIIQNLEQKGVLQKMRAQLRAHIYHLIDEDRSTDANANNPANSSSPNSEAHPSTDDASNTTHQPFASTVDDVIALSLVQDLLDCLQLSFTSSMLKSEVASRTSLNWSRRKIADVLRLDLDDDPDANGSNSSAATRQDYSEDTFNEMSNGSVNDATTESGNIIENGNDGTDGKALSVSTADVKNNKTASESKRTPLLVEILRRLPKTTDGSNNESSSNKSSNETTTNEVNNETFVTVSTRTPSNQLSESF